MPPLISKATSVEPAAHLALRDLGLRMVGPARIDQARDLGMLGERDRDGRRRVGLPLHAHGERLEPLEQHPGIERRERRAGLADELVDVVLDELLGAEDDAAEAAALAVDVLGRRIDHAVGAELERALVERRREHVVDHERRAGRMRDLGDRLDVDHLERRVGRAFEEEGLGVRPHRVAPLRRGRCRRPASRRCRSAADDPRPRSGRSRTAPWRRPRDRRPCSWPISAVVTAAMPVAVARAASAPSSAAMRCLEHRDGRVGRSANTDSPAPRS